MRSARTFIRRPQIAREVLRALEARGVDAIRASLVHVAAGDQHGHPLRPELQALYALRQTDSAIVSVARADAEQWLAWKTARNDAWGRVERGSRSTKS